uniref:Small nuclear RNA activating complex polypeptide 5 n=1 Tax=Moschus moschiferus TaxID=68415 RepID=A0A8C6CHS3_MOSMO
MLSRLQELRKEEETLLRLKAALHDQLNRLKVEELALQSMISSRRGGEMLPSQPAPEPSHDVSLIIVSLGRECSPFCSAEGSEIADYLIKPKELWGVLRRTFWFN